MLGIEDVTVLQGDPDETTYQGCLKVREDRKSHVWGPDRVRIRYRCPGLGEVLEYRMQQGDARLSGPDEYGNYTIDPQTEGRLYELRSTNLDDAE